MACRSFTTRKPSPTRPGNPLAGSFCMGLDLRGLASCAPGAPGFADPAAITHYVRQVVAHDLGNTKSVTGQMLKRAGGSILAPLYK